MGQPLEGVRVLDLSRFIAGPFCGQILGDLGADVIKIERPAGEDARFNPPVVDGESLYVLSLNRNKRGMTLNTRSPAAIELLARLVEKSDVLVENFRPGTLERMGLGPERLRELNPRLILTSISGFGQDGPLAERALFDAIAQAMSGLMSLTGTAEPTLAGTYIADYVAGLYGAIGTLAALRARDQNGEGQVVDIASLDGLFSCLATQATAVGVTGKVPLRHGNRDPLTAPGNVFRALDGSLYLHGGTEPLFPRLCAAMGRPELATDERYRDIPARVANVDAIEAVVAEWVSSRTVEEVGEALTEAAIPWGPMASLDELFDSEQLREREMIMELDNPRLGKVRVPGTPLKLSRTPGRLRMVPPGLGEHTDEVLGELGISAAEIAELRRDGAV